MKKRLVNGLLGARVAKPLFSVLVLTGVATSAWSVQVTESSPSYVAPSERAQRAIPPVMEEAHQVQNATATVKSDSGFTQISNDSIAAAEETGDAVEDFGIITDSVGPANPLADDRQLLVHELQTLRSKVENQEREIRELKEKSKALYEDLDRRLQKMAEKLVALETSPSNRSVSLDGSASQSAIDSPSGQNSSDSSTANAGDTDQSRYQNAKAILDEGGRDTKAALEFVRLLKDYPDTPLKPNIYYWLAQIYKRSGEIEKAEGFYNRVLEEYPNSIKAASSLYSLASMKSNQGLKSEADQLIKRLLESYPNSAEAIKVKASSK